MAMEIYSIIHDLTLALRRLAALIGLIVFADPEVDGFTLAV